MLLLCKDVKLVQFRIIYVEHLLKHRVERNRMKRKNLSTALSIRKCEHTHTHNKNEFDSKSFIPYFPHPDQSHSISSLDLFGQQFNKNNVEKELKKKSPKLSLEIFLKRINLLVGRHR